MVVDRRKVNQDAGETDDAPGAFAPSPAGGGPGPGDPPAAPTDQFKGFTAQQIPDPVLRKALNGQFETITPQWLGASTDPTIGNGTLTGWYLKIGFMLTITVQVTWGSTTTNGSGLWTFALPSHLARVADGDWMGTAYADDAGTARVGAAVVLDTSSSINIYSDGGTAGWQSTTPHTWANGDVLRFTLQYRATE